MKKDEEILKFLTDRKKLEKATENWSSEAYEALMEAIADKPRKQRWKEFQKAEIKMFKKEDQLVKTFNQQQMKIYNELLELRDIFYVKAGYVYRNICVLDDEDL